MLLSRLLKAAHPLCMVHVADVWMASSSQPREFEDVGEIEVFRAAGCPVGWMARYGKRNSEHRDQTRANRWRSCRGRCQVGRLILRLVAWQSVEGPASRCLCKHTRQDVVPISHPPWRPELYTLTLVYTLTLKNIWVVITRILISDNVSRRFLVQIAVYGPSGRRVDGHLYTAKGILAKSSPSGVN